MIFSDQVVDISSKNRTPFIPEAESKDFCEAWLRFGKLYVRFAKADFRYLLDPSKSLVNRWEIVIELSECLRSY